MNTIKRYLLSVLFLCVSLSAFSQASVYPIQLSAAMLPPYTNCMGDYFSNGRVQLKVIVRDMSRYDASLEYSISVKIKQGGRVVLASKGPLKRRFSQAQIVNDISLRDLFSDRNNYTVTGGANNFFDNGYCLEEGSYEFEYQLFDKNNGKMPLSEPFSVYCYLTQAEPPVGVFPEDGKCYEESELPQTILFQWIDPIAIGPQNRSYELHIKENGTDMNFTGNMFSTQDAPSSMEVYNQNVYNNNFVLINNSSGKFEVGNTYYWYVQTKSVADGIHGQNAYKNNGKSQTYSFSIGNCHQEEPKIDFDDSKAKNKAQSKVKIELDEVKVEGDVVTPKWELKSNKDNELICGFKIYCYKAGGNPDDASEVKNMTFICDKFMEGYMWTDNLNSSVLEKGVEYFCFVRPVVKDGAIGLKSNEISFKLASPNASSSSKNEDDGCGVDLEHRPCEELLTTVPKYFFANDGHQVILVDQTTKLEGDAFTGAGIITPAWLKNMVPDVMPLTGLNVEFEKIKINSDGYLCEGEIKVVSDPATNLYFDLNELVDFKAGSDAAAKQREVYTKEVDKKEDIKGDVFNGQIVHEKSTGDLYAVPMGGGTPEKVAKCLNKREYCPLQYRGALNDAGIYLRFDVDATLNDGYSPYIDKEAKPFTAENILNGYVSSGSDYIQPWISMVQGETKYIKAYFEGGSVDPDDVEFYLISQNSIALLEKSYENGYFKVRIYGGQPTRSLQIVARSKAKKKDCSDGNNSDSKDGNATNTDTNAGTNGNSASSDNDSNKNSNDCKECEAVTYGSAQIYMLSSKKIKVMLVPVVQNATDNNLNIDDLKAKVSAANDIINQRFAPLGRQFELVVDGAFEYKDIDTNTGFNVSEDNSEWTKETEEMKALRKAYGLKVGKRDEYQACLFLLTQAQKKGLQGYMPRSNSVGFIFLGDNFANVQSDIMAHELCHGLFGLQHTFAYAGVTEGAVKENLMDYVAHNDERYLSKYFQWNNMERFNGHVFKLLDDVEDGEFKYGDELVLDILQKVKCAMASGIKYIYINPGLFAETTGTSSSEIIMKNGDFSLSHSNDAETKFQEISIDFETLDEGKIELYDNLVWKEEKEYGYVNKHYWHATFAKGCTITIYAQDKQNFEKCFNTKANKEPNFNIKNVPLEELLHASYCFLQLLTTEEIQTIIERYLNNTTFWSTEDENFIIRLLIVVNRKDDESGKKDLYNYLTQSDIYLKLYSRIGNAGGLDNLNRFISEMLTLSCFDDRFKKVSDNELDNLLTVEFPHKVESLGRSKFTKSGITLPGAYQFPPKAPSDYVYIEFSEDFRLSDGTLLFEKGNTVRLPIFFAEFLFTQKANEATWEVVNIVVALAAIYASGGALTESSGLLLTGKGIWTSRILNTVNIINNVVTITTLGKTSGFCLLANYCDDPNAQKFWNVFDMVWNITFAVNASAKLLISGSTIKGVNLKTLTTKEKVLESLNYYSAAIAYFDIEVAKIRELNKNNKEIETFINELIIKVESGEFKDVVEKLISEIEKMSQEDFKKMMEKLNTNNSIPY